MKDQNTAPDDDEHSPQTSLHPDGSKDEEYRTIEKDIDSNNFDSLRRKFHDLDISSKKDPPDRSLATPNVLRYVHLWKTANILPKGDDKTFSRWRNGKAEWQWDTQAAIRLLFHLWKNTYWSLRERARRRSQEFGLENYYTALIYKMRCKRATEELVGTSAPGIYQIWRPSIVMPQRYVFGLFAVYKDDEEAGAIKTLELHRLKAILSDRHGTEETGIISEPALEEIYHGYMVKKGNQILVHAFDSVSRAFQLTAISNTIRTTAEHDGVFQVMTGITTGLLGQQSFFSLPIVFIRHTEKLKNNAVPWDGKKKNSDPDFAKLEHKLPDFTTTDLAMLWKMRSQSIYEHLGLLHSAPEFVMTQLQNAQPRLPINGKVPENL